MKNLLFFTISLILISCGGTKKVERNVASGNYDTAIHELVKKLQKGKTKRKSYEQILLLEDAYKKAVERDQRKLSQYATDNNPAVFKNIYETYVLLENRQNKIRPLLPLYVSTENRNADFVMNNYNQDILNSRNKLSDYLYSSANELLKSEDTWDAREAYGHLEYVNNINPGYKNVTSLMQKAHASGIEYTLVFVENSSDKVIPKTLEDDLLNMESYKLNEFWNIYHNSKQPGIRYNYDLMISFEQILISPDRIREKEIIETKTIKDGFIYVLDDNGNVKKDSLGNDIKKDKLIEVRSKVLKISQTKSVAITAKARFFIANTDQLIESFPIASEFVFEHHFATHTGDRRALSGTYLDMVRRKRVPFPSSEALIYETGEDIKRQLTNIIRGNPYKRG